MSNQLREQISTELNNHIMPFWMKLKDDVYGGFYGEVDYHLSINKEADKGGIASARHLWSFSAAYRVTKNKRYLECAKHIYEFMLKHLFDETYKGIYWMVDYKGSVLDDRKHIYAQSFAIYGLSEYFRATGEAEALRLAQGIFYLIEDKGFNQQNEAYMEEFSREWMKLPNEKLSENGVIAEITMNTHIHILESYTNLYKIWPDQKLKNRLETLMQVHYEKIYDKNTKFLGVFFDDDWKSILDIKSFGHDIEASWLMDETIKTIGITNEKYDEMNIDIAYNIADYAIQEDGSLINEEENGILDKTRVWWVQAEAMVGFYNAYERTNDEQFLTLVKGLWEYTKKNIIDSREGGEWYWSIEPNGKVTERSIGEPWKVSYHNSRFCLELIERMAK